VHTESKEIAEPRFQSRPGMDSGVYINSGKMESVRPETFLAQVLRTQRLKIAYDFFYIFIA